MTIGSRGSLLALTQTRWVAQRFLEEGEEVTIRTIKTTGDLLRSVPLSRVGGKGLFVKEIEEALLAGTIDLAVHSMKDMPAKIPPGLHIGAIPKREDPRDALISRNGTPWANLPPGSRVGTSSLRRQAQLKGIRPDLFFPPLRGNLDTRLRKLSEGVIDLLVVAAAGLHRMGWSDRITEYLPVEISLPAIGQGALAIECRESDQEVNARIAFLNHLETAREIAAERAMLIRLGGGCQMPIAGFAKTIGHTMELEGLVADGDGTTRIREKKVAPAAEAQRLGRDVAERLLSKGADQILKRLSEQDHFQ